MTVESGRTDGAPSSRRFLFAACFVALVATSFAFIIRVMVMSDWQIAFGLSETQKGEIFGAGMWPFGISIVLFSLIVDRIGYGRSMIFAFLCHLASTILLVSARGYGMLYAGSFLNGLAAGTVEAIINPAVASMYPRQKTKMLTMLHAGWPGGMVLGGLIIKLLGLGGLDRWEVRVAVILIPVLAYGIMLLKCRFPVSERVAAGVPYKEMLAEAGAIGWLIVVYMIIMEVNRLLGLPLLVDTTFFDLPSVPMLALLVVLTGGYFAYTKAAGRPMYIFLLLVMILLAITELGTDTWIKELMAPAMGKMDSVWILIYTASIMTVLRFCIGPIERKLRPLGVLLVSALFAACGLYFLPKAHGLMIVVMATVYGTGQCFFWPVTLGLVSEQFPKGGALTLNAIGGVGMLGVGILGSQLLGFWQDTKIDANLQPETAVYERMMSPEPRQSIFGEYRALNNKATSAVADKVALYEYRLGKDPAALAGDKEYQTLVRNAHSHVIGPVRDLTHAEMETALAAAGMFVDEAGYAAAMADKKVLDAVSADAKRGAMQSVAVLPLIMAACYLGLIVYFRSKGGYKTVELASE